MADVLHAAVLTKEDGSLCESRGHIIPLCPSEAVLVKVYSVALNPSDYKVAALVKRPGLVSGCDFSGEVVEVGANANALLSGSRQPWVVGDRVCGAVFGANPDKPNCGAFAQFVEADPLVLIRIPRGWDWNAAAAIGGSCIGVIGIALFKELRLNLGDLRRAIENNSRPNSRAAKIPARANDDLKRVVLVYGGSTACGSIAIQILAIAGYTPITTCSPHNNALVRSCGAAAAFDYSSTSCALDIKTYTKNALTVVVDCIATAQSAILCYAAIGRAGGRYTSLEKIPDSVLATRRAVQASWAMGPLMLGGCIKVGDYSLDADPASRDFARSWFAVVQSMLCSGKIQPHPIRLMQTTGNWVEEIIRGLAALRQGVISGQKLVVAVT
ncbi:putative alcohol dehydrogenase [Hypoxylon sp. FL0890]|nr:putative alcohol dehydrogenase [Hypoxylon sp. FL0890]